MPYSQEDCFRKINDVTKLVKDGIYTKIVPLQVEAWVTPEPVPFAERTSGEHKTLFAGDSWGKLWDCAWFCFSGKIPCGCRGKSLVLMIDISGEVCLVDEKGVPCGCLTNVNSEFDTALGRPGKRIFVLDEEACKQENITLWGDAGCNDLFGRYCDSGKVLEADIAVCDNELRDIYYDFVVLQDLLESIDTDSPRFKRTLQQVYEAACLVTSPAFDREKVKKILQKELDKKCGDESLRITAIGHSHLDLAWLWPIRETKRKGARTFSNVLRLMERYPDFVFGASQPQLYQWVKDGYPQLYSRVKKKVKENRWECQGAMWVEADTNISGAEPLVRQFLYGKKFFAEEFGVDARSLWLPDVFGYSAALPQIMKKSGVDYFVTQKLCWSQFDVYPHHTFWWQGIDGSQVLSHLLPENTYNGSAMPRSLKKIEKNYKDNAVCEEALMLFGIGDGAGGPSPFHLESLKRTKKLNGLVECEQGYSADMLDRIAEDTHGYKKWVGELYLERHQGTYTTQSRIKRFNRKTEFALRETEFACAWASRAAVFAYPQEELEAIWKEYLLYQFHDILPGSSINRVYKEAEERFEFLLKRLNEIKKNAYRAVAEQYAEANESMVFNSLPFEVTTQLKTTAGYRKITVPAMGMTNLKECTDDLAPCVAQACVLENSKLRVLFNEQGEITSIFDLESEREVLQANANIFRVYNDRGDAWDMRVNYTDDAFETMRLDRCEWSVEGENAVCTQVFAYGASVLQQRVVLTQDGLVKFETKMDWRERDRMVRTAFPVDVLTNEVECDIQFGSVKRATNENTTWQYAQYEICAQKWVDLSQADYGAAVLNNGKYGYRCKDNVIDIDLLRSPSYPDVAADYGEHKFTYAFYPHRGNRMNSAVVRLAYQLNAPLTVVKTGETATGAEPALPRLFELNGDGSAVIESVKLAEDGKGIVVRLYETNGASCAFSLTPSFAFSRASEVDLMERELTECDTKNGTIHAKLKPFEIFSIKIS